jgi:pimeloyl-ACP methyl ester carboxylesterase
MRSNASPGCVSPYRSTAAGRAIRIWRAAPSIARQWGCTGLPRPGGESDGFDLFPDLGRIRCPTLVLGGEDDPMHPIESQTDIAAALPPHLVQFERFADCRHGVMPDAPERTLAVIRDFISKPK